MLIIFNYFLNPTLYGLYKVVAYIGVAILAIYFNILRIGWLNFQESI